MSNRLSTYNRKLRVYTYIFADYMNFFHKSKVLTVILGLFRLPPFYSSCIYISDTVNSIREQIGRISEENEVKNKPALHKTFKLPKSKSPKLNFFTPKLRCTFCEKTFRNKAVMRIHMKKHGVKENIDPNRFKKASIEEIKQKIRDLQCTKCNYKFLKKKSFDEHVKKCHEEETLTVKSRVEARVTIQKIRFFTVSNSSMSCLVTCLGL